MKKDLSKFYFCNNETKSMPEGSWFYSSDIYEAIRGTDAILLLTEWDVYKDLDWEKISNVMRISIHFFHFLFIQIDTF